MCVHIIMHSPIYSQLRNKLQAREIPVSPDEQEKGEDWEDVDGDDAPDAGAAEAAPTYAASCLYGNVLRFVLSRVALALASLAPLARRSAS